MIRIRIKKADKITNQSDFKNVSDATKWFDEHKTKNTFGKNDRELLAQKNNLGNYVIDGEDITKAISFRDLIDEKTGEQKRYYRFRAEYTVEIEDVTAEYAQRDANRQERESLNAQLKQLHTDIQSAQTLVEIKPILVKLIKFIYLSNS